jgi:betaine reductase
VASIVPISVTVGANRIVPAIAIPHPLGNPELQESEEFELRLKISCIAIKALQANIEKQTVFNN